LEDVGCVVHAVRHSRGAKRAAGNQLRPPTGRDLGWIPAGASLRGNDGQIEEVAEPPEPFERRSRVVPTRCRWAPFVRDHGLGQGQLPCESYRPPGRCSNAPRSPARRYLRRVRQKSMHPDAIIPWSASPAIQMRARSCGWMPALASLGGHDGFGSSLALEDIVQRVQSPGDAVAHLSLALLELAHTRLRTVQLLLERITLALEHRQALRQRRAGIGALGLALWSACARRRGCTPRLACAAPGHCREPAVIVE